jgi:parallel beta-helix repeat protein
MPFRIHFWPRVFEILYSLLLISFLPGFSGVTHAQGWTTQTVPISNGKLEDVAFVDENTGWAVGQDDETGQAAIIHTINGGEEWVLQANPLTGALYGIYILNSDTGYAVGQDHGEGWAAILRTTDGGQLWQGQNLPPVHGSIDDVQFLNATEGWAVGVDFDDFQSLILHTEDGTTWTASEHAVPSGMLSSVHFSDMNHGWAVGGDSDGGPPIIMHTSNRGTTWVELIHPVESGWFMDVFFIDPDTGWVAGSDDTSAVLFKTVDGGINWVPMNLQLPAVSSRTSFQAEPNRKGSRMGGGQNVIDVLFRDDMLLVLLNILEESIVRLYVGGGSPTSTESTPGTLSEIEMIDDKILGVGNLGINPLITYTGMPWRLCSVEGEVEPPQAKNDKCFVTPAQSPCQCGVEEIEFMQQAGPGWEFDKWIPDGPLLMCPEEGVAVKTGVFAPYLTAAGGGDQFLCSGEEHENVTIVSFTLTASEADDWEVKHIIVTASGDGNDKNDITEVRLQYSGGTKNDTYTSDDGFIDFDIGTLTIEAGKSESFTLFYDFAKMEECATDFKDFMVSIDHDAESVDFPPGHLHGAAGASVTVGCIIHEDTEEPFDSIQEAVSAAAPHQTILVCPGTYEENVDVTESVKITSKEGYQVTTVASQDTGKHVFHVRKDNTTIEGFTITGAAGVEMAGIYVFGSVVNNSTIRTNSLTGNTFGIYLNSANETTIQGNKIHGNSGAGVYIVSSANSEIASNIIDGNTGDGIHLFDHTEDSTRIKNNWIRANTGNAGIHLRGSAGVIVEENWDISQNRIGIRLESCQSIKINGNPKIRNNLTDGILIMNSGNTEMRENVIISNGEAGVRLQGPESTENKFYGNYIGTDEEGTDPSPNKYGIYILDGAHANSITADDGGHVNLISGNTESGVRIEGEGTQGNRIWDNHIGTTGDGTGVLPNKYGIHILDKARSNYIGVEVEGKGNLISGNTESGLRIEGQDTKENVVWGNYIGMQKDGLSELRDQQQKYGIHLLGKAHSNTVAEWNLISDNTESGVRMEGEDTRDNNVWNNIIGPKKDGEFNFVNQRQKYGIHLLNGATNNQIGSDDEGKGNHISGNIESGVRIEGQDTKTNEILGNSIGPNDDGDFVLLDEKLQTRQKYGVHILDKAQANAVTGLNIISGNTESGIRIEGDGTNENKIWDNRIGTNNNGTKALPNTLYGIHILGKAQSNLIGNEAEGKGNLISGNVQSNIRIEGQGTKHNHVWGNYIGPDKDGIQAMSDDDGDKYRQNFGIQILNKAESNLIGRFNVISANWKDGVVIEGEGSTDNRIFGNFIGTTQDGTDSLGNSWGVAIRDKASLNIIGGSMSDDRNIISSNHSSGVSMSSGAHHNRIQANYIGTDKNGITALPNGSGVWFGENAIHNIIGGTTDGEKNVISGNRDEGVALWTAHDNRVEGNYIGTDYSGTEVLSNKTGVSIHGSAWRNIIGGTARGARNIIAGNTKMGVDISHAYGNKILGNHVGTDISGLRDMGGDIGIYIEYSSENTFIDNLVMYNCEGIVEKESKLNKFHNNVVSDSYCLFTGILLDNSSSEFIGNSIVGNQGDGIHCVNGSHPAFSKNNIFNNDPFGLNNSDPAVTITAENNWWGDITGPGGSGTGSGDAVSEDVVYSGWRSEPVAVVVAAETDTVFIPRGATDSVYCSFQNWENPVDVLDVSLLPDSVGWIPGFTGFPVALHDSLIAFIAIAVQAPSELSAGSVNTIQITAVSQADAEASDVDSFLVVMYNPDVCKIDVLPDSVVLDPGDNFQFYAQGYDSVGNSVALEIVWSSNGGTVDSTGRFTAGELGGIYSIIATDTASGIEGYATLFISRSPQSGDVNCDGNITPGDALCCFWRAILGSFQADCQCGGAEQAAEVNCDGNITPGDALCIFWRSILGDWTEECQCQPMVKVTPGENKTTIRIGSARGYPGEPVTIPIVIEKPIDIDAFGLQLAYPSDILVFQTVSPTPMTKDWTILDGREREPGIVSLGGFHTAGLSSDETVTVAEVTFLVKENATGGGQLNPVNPVDDLAGAFMVKGNITTQPVPREFALAQNYPNPFNPCTDIRYQIADGKSPVQTTLKIYNILGQEVRTLVDENKEPGYYIVTWDGKDNKGVEVSSGIYFYSLRTEQYMKTKRMLLIR